jgi:Sec-independent protein translocase protein TatA
MDNFFGIGLPEAVLIVIVMLVVAGPKRMIRWSYFAGRYIAAARNMFQEAVRAFQREIDMEGVLNDVPKLPKPGQKFDIVKEADKLIRTEIGDPKASAKAEPKTASTVNPPNPGQTAAQNVVSNNLKANRTPNSTPDTTDDSPRYDAWTSKDTQ